MYDNNDIEGSFAGYRLRPPERQSSTRSELSGCVDRCEERQFRECCVCLDAARSRGRLSGAGNECYAERIHPALFQGLLPKWPAVPSSLGSLYSAYAIGYVCR